MDKTTIAAALPPSGAPTESFALPETGEALLTPRLVFGALGISESTGWEWVKTDPEFPQPVRRGERFTRFRLSEVRAYIASLTSGVAKPSPAQRKARSAALGDAS